MKQLIGGSVVVVLALAVAAPAGAQDLQQKLAAAKENAAPEQAGAALVRLDQQLAMRLRGNVSLCSSLHFVSLVYCFSPTRSVI